MKGKRSICWLLFVTIAASLVLAACAAPAAAPAAKPPAPTSPPAAAPATAPAAAPVAKAPITDKVTVQMSWVTCAQHAGFVVAKENGYYAAEGIDVTILPGGPDTSPVQQVATGLAQFGLADYPEIVGARAQSVPVTIIGHVYHEGPLRMFAFAKSGIKTPADFKGHKVGVWFGGNEYEFMALMDKFKLDWKKDMTVVQEGFTIDPFLTGELDVAMGMVYDQLLAIYEAGYKPEEVNVIDLRDYGVGMASQVLFVDEGWLAKNKDLAVRFMRASIKGWQDAIKNRPAAVKLVMDKYMEKGVSTLSLQTDMLNYTATMVVAPRLGMSENDILAINVPDFENSAGIAYKYGLVKQPVDVPATYKLDIWEAATGRKTPAFK